MFGLRVRTGFDVETFEEDYLQFEISEQLLDEDET